jgi:hypothetical protein
MDADESNQLCDRRLHIDGGVWDDGGLMALPSVPPSNLIVNIVCGRGRIRSSVLPDKFKDARVRTATTRRNTLPSYLCYFSNHLLTDPRLLLTVGIRTF